MNTDQTETAFPPESALSPIRRPKTTAEEVEARLVMAIACGDKKSGDRLTEAEISGALNISRGPAREAMQKLLMRGILEESGLRGLRVADYGPRRIAELVELRFAIERILFQAVMAPDFDNAPLLAELEGIVEEMRQLSGIGDPIALSTIDLDFHRAIAEHSGNILATQIWEGLAQHMFIVFCRDWLSAADRTGEVDLHSRLLDFIRDGDVNDLDAVLRDHFSGPVTRLTINS